MNNIYVIMGASGSGKTEIAEEAGRRLNAKQCYSYTDREKREGESCGHQFLTKEEFDALEGRMLETVFAGNRYAMTKDLIENSDILVLDVPGAKELKESYCGSKKIAVIGISCMEETAAVRMRKRGDLEEKIHERIEHDRTAFEEMPNVCDVIIVNEGTFEEAVSSVCECMERMEG